MIGRGRDLSMPRDQMELTVKAHESIRLDLYLREALVWKSRRRIQALIRNGLIQVNGAQAKPSQGVRGGDRIQVNLSMGTGLPSDYAERQVSIIYEDSWLVAIDKPPGLLVHPVGRHVYDTLMNYLHFRYQRKSTVANGESTVDSRQSTVTDDGRTESPVQPERGAPGSRYPGRIDEKLSIQLCHRIDKDTTGIVLVGKESYVHQRVQRQFETRKVSKEYLTLAAGIVPEGLEEIQAPIGEGASLAEALQPPRKPARTLIQCLERFSGPAGDFSLVLARPVTGRQNQIRVHLAVAGHPVAGDLRYGGPAISGFPDRYLLHSRWIRFFHPRLKTFVELSAPPPADFQELIEKLRADSRIG